jgi:gliding motility-associated-like protein
VIEQDYIRELFSRTLENHTSPVRPEVWNGLQAKMAAAGVSSVGAGAAAKGLSALTKWMIGSAAVAGTAVIATIAVVNSPAEPKKEIPVQTETSQTVPQEELQPATTRADGTQTTVETNTVQQQPDQRTLTLVPAYQDGGFDVPPPVKQEPAKEILPSRIFPLADPKPEKPVVIQLTEDPKEDAVAAKEPEKAYEAAKIEFPNVFTPNGDHHNDTYSLIKRENIKSMDIVITNEQNKVVYRSNDPAFEWDGTYNGDGGEPVPDGMYACSVVYKDFGDKTKKEINLLEITRTK